MRLSLNRREFVSALSAVLSGCCLPSFDVRRRLAFNPSTFREFKLPLEDQVRLAIKAGFRGFEPWLKDVRSADASGRLSEIRHRAEDAGLEFINGIAFGCWSHPDSGVRSAGLDETKRDMDMLRRLGCVRIAASLYGIHRPGSPKVTLDEIAERYTALLELGRREGVRPLLEYWGHSAVMNTPEKALQVIRMADDEDAAILADVFHTYKGSGSFTTFTKFTPQLMPVLHVNDYPARPPVEMTDADRVWPGDGVAPWAEIIGALRSAGNVSPWLSIELFNLSYQKMTPDWTACTGYEKMVSLFG